MTPATDPERIAVSKSTGVRIDWKDGHHSHYSLQYLRAHCPCASCTAAGGAAGGQQASPFPMYKPALRIEGVEPVGNYAIKIRWNDGHDAGIYTFEHLRAISPGGPKDG